MSKEKATSDMKEELEKIKVKAETLGIDIKAKVVEGNLSDKVKTNIVDLKDKIIELDIPSHIKSGAITVKDKFIDLKDKCIELNYSRKERRKERQNIANNIQTIGTKIDDISERLTKLEKESKEGS